MVPLALLLASSAPAQEIVVERPPPSDDVGAKVMAQTWASPMVQQCFVPLIKPPAVPPGLVEVLFSLETDGTVSDIAVKQSRWHGTEFETCLRVAIPSVVYDKPDRKLDLTLPFNLGPPVPAEPDPPPAEPSPPPEPAPPPEPPTQPPAD